MDTFKRPELSDRQWVNDLLSREGSRACEHNFASIYLWATAYPQKIARVGDRLLVEMMGGPGLSHLFPMGSGPLGPALEAAKADAAAVFTVSLPLSGWTGSEGAYAQTVSAASAVADRVPLAAPVVPEAGDAAAVRKDFSCIDSLTVGAGSVTAAAAAKPGADLTLRIALLG